MPRLINTILGKVRGTLNDLTFFYKNNVQFVKSRKKPHTKSQSNSVKAKNNRKQFANSHFFSKIIICEKDIYNLWNAADVKGSSPYFKVHAFNRTKCTHKSLTEENCITPLSIPITVENLQLEKDTLKFDFKLYRKHSDYLSAPYSLFVYVFLNKGAMTTNNFDFADEFNKIEIIEEKSEFTEIDVKLKELIYEKEIPRFNNLYFFIAAVKKTNGEYEWSSTFTKMFDISGYESKWYLDKVIK